MVNSLNNGTKKNRLKKENKETRRARLAAAKKARNNAGINMFFPVIQKKVVGIANAPSEQGNIFTTPLKGERKYTTKAYNGRLSPEEIMQYHSLSIPTTINNAKTKRASRSNGWTETGNSYLHSRTPANQREERQHRLAIIEATRNLEEANKLEAQSITLRTLLDDIEGADALLLKAKRLREEAGYMVAEPTPKSLKNAAMAHEFAEGIHAKQTRKGWFGNCFGGECKVSPEPQFSGNLVRTMPTAITEQQLGNWGTRRGNWGTRQHSI